MRAMVVLLHRLNATISSRLPIVKDEARQLFCRRKMSYAVLAATLAGAVLYVGTMGRPLVTQTEAGSPGATIQPESGGQTMQQDQASPSANSNEEQGSDTGQLGPETDAGNTSAGSSARSQTSVVVNGQSLDVPTNGSTHTIVPNGDGQASVTITHSTSGGGSSSIHVDVTGASGGGTSESP